MKERFLRLEVLFDLVLLAIGVAVVVFSMGYGFGRLARPGPGLYPVFLGVAIAGCALFVLIADVRAPAASGIERDAGVTLALMSAVFCLWILLMPWLGYALVTFLAVFAIAKIMHLEGWKQPLWLSGGTALFIYLLFDHWLYVDLPRGIFG